MPRNLEALLDVQRADHARAHKLLRRDERLWTRIFEHLADDSGGVIRTKRRRRTRDFYLTSQRGFETVAMNRVDRSANEFLRQTRWQMLDAEREEARQKNEVQISMSVQKCSTSVRSTGAGNLTSIIMLRTSLRQSGRKLPQSLRPNAPT